MDLPDHDGRLTLDVNLILSSYERSKSANWTFLDWFFKQLQVDWFNYKQIDWITSLFQIDIRKSWGWRIYQATTSDMNLVLK